jgi:hypothetical protein
MFSLKIYMQFLTDQDEFLMKTEENISWDLAKDIWFG